MSNKFPGYSKRVHGVARRFLVLAKRLLGLVLLVLEIVRRWHDLIR